MMTENEPPSYYRGSKFLLKVEEVGEISSFFRWQYMLIGTTL